MITSVQHLFLHLQNLDERTKHSERKKESSTWHILRENNQKNLKNNQHSKQDKDVYGFNYAALVWKYMTYVRPLCVFIIPQSKVTLNKQSFLQNNTGIIYKIEHLWNLAAFFSHFNHDRAFISACVMQVF